MIFPLCSLFPVSGADPAAEIPTFFHALFPSSGVTMSHTAPWRIPARPQALHSAEFSRLLLTLSFRLFIMKRGIESSRLTDFKKGI